MRVVMVMFDSLNRRMLSPYGCDWVHTPNFRRLAERAATFDTSYVGSMPCMPARREIHTARLNFLHRSWSPLEPFDDSMPEILKNNGVYTHLVSDHYHYWEDGGCNYHTRYDSWDVVRGQEGDPWKAETHPVEVNQALRSDGGAPRAMTWHDTVNRTHIRREEDFPQARTFAAGLEFMRANSDGDNWFLQLETFDPHEPYFAAQRFRDLYPHDYDGPLMDWPPYRRVQETPEEVEHIRFESAALHSMCDDYLGKVLDVMDELQMWDDTMLIVNTDHGFLLGEHDWWAKCCQPFYNEIAHTPLFIWNPRCEVQGERRKSLVQTIDLAPTIMEFFGVETTPDMQGKPLADVIADDTPVREAALFGIHGGHVNVTDGRYVYMRANVTENNEPLYEYTLMPTHMRHSFATEELQDIQLAEPFSFTKGCRTMKIAGRSWVNPDTFGTLLFDLASDPEQNNPICNAAVEERMVRLMVELMKENDAPTEQYERLGLGTD